MSQIKDKIIKVYEVKAERDIKGDEVKLKRYIHGVNGLHAYVRELSEREKFAAKAAGSEQSVIFKVNFNPRLRAGLCLDFNLPDGRQAGSFVIESIDGYEFYQRDLTLRATRIKQEVFDYEEFNE